MAKVKVVLNREGVREMLRSQEMLDICRNAAAGIQSNYGSDTELSEYVGKSRVNVSVIANYDEASTDNSLLKAVH